MHPEPLSSTRSEAMAGAVRVALAAGIDATHQGMGYIRDHLAAKVLPQRLASLVSSGHDRPEQESAGTKQGEVLTSVAIEDLDTIKALVEKYGAARIKHLADMLG